MSAAWVYRCFDTNDRLIYVGVTGDLASRLHGHLAHWWAPQVVKVRAKVYRTMREARGAERTAIVGENPRWNVAVRSRARLSWSAQDYLDYAVARSMCSSRATVWTTSHLARIAAEYERRFGHRMPRPLAMGISA